MKKYLTIVAIMMTTMSSQVHAEVDAADVKSRCEDDSLTPAQAVQRVNWAQKCQLIQATEDSSVQALVNWMLYKDGNPAQGLREKPKYPTLTNAAGKNPAGYYAPPKGANADCSAVPPGYSPLITCTSSCYKPTERILLQNGYFEIKKAMDLKDSGQVGEVVGLTDGATLDHLQFGAYPITSFTQSLVETNVKIVHITTASGASLSVTLNHPLVVANGFIKEAGDLVVGDLLLKASGEKDSITNLEKEDYFGKVYNLQSVPDQRMPNVFVAEGFLSGSAWYQNDGYAEVNKAIFRANLNLDALITH